MFRSFRYRLYPTKSQARRLEATLAVCRQFFNKLLVERREAHKAGHRLSVKEQLRQVAVFRKADPVAAEVHSHSLQLVASDVDRAWRAWLNRGKMGNDPQMRDESDARSFGFKQARNGFSQDGRRLRLFGIGRVAVRWHRSLQGTLKTLRISRVAGRWFAAFGCEIEPTHLAPTSDECGIDMGTGNIVTLSTGEQFSNPRWAFAAHDRLTALRDRLHQATPGTPAYRKAMLRVARTQVAIAARRQNYLSNIVARLVERFDRIALENVNTARLSNLRASVADAGWGLFRRLLQARAEATGRIVVLVNPRWSTKTCAVCGQRNRRHMPLNERQFRCEQEQCNYTADRDVNAARVILRRAQGFWESRE